GSSAEIRRSRFESSGKIFAPFEFASSRFIARKNAGDAERVEFAVGNNRRRLWPFAVSCGRWVHGISYRITIFPEWFSSFQVETIDGFLFSLSGDKKNLFAGDNGRRMTDTHINFPFEFELFGKGFRCNETSNCAVTVCATPLIPLLRVCCVIHQQDSKS